MLKSIKNMKNLSKKYRIKALKFKNLHIKH